MSSSFSKAWPFPPASPRHGHFLQPHQGMDISSRLTKAWAFPSTSPRHGHFLLSHQGMAISFTLSPRRGHVLQAVQTTRAQHSPMQPPPATALQNQIPAAEKLPSDALFSPGKWFKLAAYGLDPAQCLCVTEPERSLLYQGTGMKLNLSRLCSLQPNHSLLAAKAGAPYSSFSRVRVLLGAENRR